MKKLLIPVLAVLAAVALHTTNGQIAYATTPSDCLITATDSNALLIAKAKERFGRNFLGADAINNAFKLTEPTDKVNENAYIFPLTLQEIEMFDTARWIVILQVNTIKGHPTTIKYMESSGGKTTCGGYQCIGDMDKGLKEEFFYYGETLEAGYKIVSKKNIPESFNEDYSDQTKKLEQFIGEDEILAGNELLRARYIAAAEEFRHDQKPVIDALMNPKKQTLKDSADAQLCRAAQQLAAVQINISARERAVDVFYRMILYLAQNKVRLFEDTYVWTRSMTADCRFIGIGGFIQTGMAITAVAVNDKGKNGGTTCFRALSTFHQP